MYHDFENKKDEKSGKYKQCKKCHRVCLPDDYLFNMICSVVVDERRETIKRLKNKK